MEEKMLSDRHSIKMKEFEIQFDTTIVSAKYSKKGKYIIFLTSELVPGHFFLQEALIIYDIENNHEKSRINLNSPSMIQDYICIDDGDNNYVLAVFQSTIQLWNIDTGVSCGTLRLNVGSSLATGIHTYAMSHDATYIAYLAADKTKLMGNADYLRIFNIKEDIKIYEDKDKYSFTNLLISPDNKYLVTIGGCDLGNTNRVKIFRFTDKNQIAYERTFVLKEIGQMKSAIFHPDGTKIFFSIGKKVFVYDFVNHELDKYLHLKHYSHSIKCIEFNHDGSLFLTKSKKEYHVWNTEDGTMFIDVKKEYEDPFDEVIIASASLSSSNNYLLLAYKNGVITNVDLNISPQDVSFDIGKEKGKEQEGFINCSKRTRKVKVGKEKEGCYIATAVYGSYNAEEVLILRKFRDQFLQKYFLGKMFIKIYYRVSPILVQRLGKNKKVLVNTRKILDKFVNICEEYYTEDKSI